MKPESDGFDVNLIIFFAVTRKEKKK